MFTVVRSAGLPQGERSLMILGREQAVRIALIDELSLPRQILVVARVQGVLSAFLHAELESEESVFAPGNVGVDVDLVEILGEVRKSLPSDGPQIHLRPRGQMNQPELGIAGNFRGAHQLVRTRAEEIAAHDVPEGPAPGAVIRDGNVEHRTGIAFFGLAGYVTERVHRQIHPQVAPQVYRSVSAARFQGPDLFLLQTGSVCVYLEPEGFRGQIPEFRVDQPDRPAALLLVLRDDVSSAALIVMTIESVHAVHPFK